MKIRYGTRGSKLALHQTRQAINIIKSSSNNTEFEEVIIKTLGDQVTGLPLFKVGGQGLFIKEIEQALLEKRIDIAVHSMKDVPHSVAEGLSIVAVGCAEDPRDCFLSKKYKSFEEMPIDAIIGTSSLRRRSQLSILKPGATFSDFRGNLDTRLRKLDEGEVDAGGLFPGLDGKGTQGSHSHQKVFVKNIALQNVFQSSNNNASAQ